jgi:TonB family protein
MLNYIAKNVKYPPVARENGIEGRVYVTFVVDKLGNIKDARILKGIGGGCDEEALRVINLMPQWIPGKQDGVPVQVQYNLPINFALGSHGKASESNSSYSSFPPPPLSSPYKPVLYKAKDTTYLSDTVSQKWFGEKNSLKIKDFLYPAVEAIQFDHCHHNQIELALYADTNGILNFVDLIEGTKIPKQDSIIISKAKTISGWSVTDSSGKKVKAVFIANLIFYDITSKHTHSFNKETDRTENYLVTTTSWSYGNTTTYNKHCEDDNYFYDEGLKNFQKGNYSDAIYDFSNASDANPNDIDAIYNLGVCYIKNDKVAKGCDCFNKIKEMGDNSVDNVVKKYCNTLK